MAQSDGRTSLAESPAVVSSFRRYQPQCKTPGYPALLQWADVIFVMEQKHKNRLKAEFTRLLDHKPLHVLEIPDDYHYGDPALIALLDDLVPPYLSAD